MIENQTGTKSSGHGSFPLWQCTRQRGWIRSQILNNQFRERKLNQRTLRWNIQFLYSCDFCESNPVNRSSLILPVPNRVSSSVLMGYLVTMNCVASVTHSRRLQKWQFVLTFRFLQQAVRVSRVVTYLSAGHKGLSSICGHTSASLLSVQTVHPYSTRQNSLCIFSTAALTTACSSLLQWPWLLQFLTNCRLRCKAAGTPMHQASAFSKSYTRRKRSLAFYGLFDIFLEIQA